MEENVESWKDDDGVDVRANSTVPIVFRTAMSDLTYLTYIPCITTVHGAGREEIRARRLGILLEVCLLCTVHSSTVFIRMYGTILKELQYRNPKRSHFYVWDVIVKRNQRNYAESHPSRVSPNIRVQVEDASKQTSTCNCKLSSRDGPDNKNCRWLCISANAWSVGPISQVQLVLPSLES